VNHFIQTREASVFHVCWYMWVRLRGRVRDLGEAKSAVVKLIEKFDQRIFEGWTAGSVKSGIQKDGSFEFGRYSYIIP